MSISSAIVMEALSRALPESAYVTEIRLEKENLRIMGLADDAPGLLAPLERSEHMATCISLLRRREGRTANFSGFRSSARRTAHQDWGGLRYAETRP